MYNIKMNSSDNLALTFYVKRLSSYWNLWFFISCLVLYLARSEHNLRPWWNLWRDAWGYYEIFSIYLRSTFTVYKTNIFFIIWLENICNSFTKHDKRLLLDTLKWCLDRPLTRLCVCVCVFMWVWLSEAVLSFLSWLKHQYWWMLWDSVSFSFVSPSLFPSICLLRLSFGTSNLHNSN